MARSEMDAQVFSDATALASHLIALARAQRKFDRLDGSLEEGNFMDSDAMTYLTILLTALSYLGTFVLGYGMRSYIYSHRRHYD